jgi:hypothetical protein
MNKERLCQGDSGIIWLSFCVVFIF